MSVLANFLLLLLLCFPCRSKFATVNQRSAVLENAMGTTTMKTRRVSSNYQSELLHHRNSFQINQATFFIYEMHWPKNSLHMKLSGKYSRPATQPSVFNLPISSLLTPQGDRPLEGSAGDVSFMDRF